jgi:hydrogenase-4 component B
VLLLLIVGAGSKAGLAPFHLWLPVAHPAAPTAASALMSAAMVKVALYVLLRGLLDLAGPAQPAWWGVPLLALGAATALIGGLRANLERDIKAILACSTLENVGLIAIGIGLVLIFRGADLRPWRRWRSASCCCTRWCMPPSRRCSFSARARWPFSPARAIPTGWAG